MQDRRAVVNALAGAGAGVINSVLCSPLDVSKLRQQLQGRFVSEKPKYHGVFSTIFTIYKEEGARGLFRGLKPSLLTMPLFWALYFPVYNSMKKELFLISDQDDAIWQHSLAAITAGFVADCATNPLWVVRTRMVSDIYHCPNSQQPIPERVTKLGVFSRMRYIARTEGTVALYKGLSASILGLSHVAVQFPVYEKLKQISREHRKTDQEPIIDLIAASALSKAIASTVTYPHEVLRSRLQDSRKHTTFRTILANILAREGWRGLFQGLQVNLVRVLPSCITVFVSYELLAKTLTLNIAYFSNLSN
eukprot:gene10413-2544_t